MKERVLQEPNRVPVAQRFLQSLPGFFNPLFNAKAPQSGFRHLLLTGSAFSRGKHWGYC